MHENTLRGRDDALMELNDGLRKRIDELRDCNFGLTDDREGLRSGDYRLKKRATCCLL